MFQPCRNPNHLLQCVLRLIAALALVAGLQPSVRAQDEHDSSEPRTHVLLINGGQSPSNNVLSHLHHLQDMLGELTERGIPASRIHVFSSDGEDPGKDLSVRGSLDPRLWLIEGTQTGRLLRRTEALDTNWNEVKLRPAKLAELRKWFVETSPLLAPGDTLMIFVTDHGTKNDDDPGNNLISLWKESMSVLEFRALIGHIGPDVHVVNVMSQCFSGGFADAMSPFHDATPSGNICGFYSTTADRRAYGCYPEGRDRDRMGHAFRFIDAMNRNATMNGAHREVLMTDATPDIPIRTSDLYFERLLQQEADRAEVSLDSLVDDLLREAWRDRARWEPQIRLLDRLGSIYGIFSPRTLAEFQTHIAGLEQLSKELATYRARWRLALDDLRRDNLTGFKKERPEWGKRLAKQKLDPLTEAERQELAAEFLTVFEEYTDTRENVRERLRTMRDTFEDVKTAEYRVEIRLAALLRMRSVLLGVAARQFLAESSTSEDLDRARLAVNALQQCESIQIGSFDPTHKPAPLTIEPLPPYREDLAVVERVLPSWLGMQFRPVPDRQREDLELQRGAVLVMQTYDGSAAEAAGLMPGDLVLGPPGDHFDEPRQVREWIMSSPQNTPLQLDAIREGQRMVVTASLGPYPIEVPQLPAPPAQGDPAPELPDMTVVSGLTEVEEKVESRRHLVFFWATWCKPCKGAVPELLAWSESSGVPILAVSDENPATVEQFLETWDTPFPDNVVTDEYRVSYVRYGVSGTPTFVIVDDDGVIEWRQTGYSAGKGLGLDGWDWGK